MYRVDQQVVDGRGERASADEREQQQQQQVASGLRGMLEVRTALVTQSQRLELGKKVPKNPPTTRAQLGLSKLEWIPTQTPG